MRRRNLKCNSLYHVYNIGNRNDPIVNRDADKEYYKAELFVKLGKFPSIKLHAYTILDKSYHLIVRIKNKEKLPRYIQQWSARISKHFNYTYDTVGTMFRSRYLSEEVSEGLDIVYLSRNIHRLCLTNDKIKDLANYKWSSIHEIKSPNKMSCIQPNLYLKYFATTNDYIKFIKEDDPQKLSSYLNSEMILTETQNTLLRRYSNIYS